MQELQGKNSNARAPRHELQCKSSKARTPMQELQCKSHEASSNLRFHFQDQKELEDLHSTSMTATQRFPAHWFHVQCKGSKARTPMQELQ
jgi:hypothetical protein